MFGGILMVLMFLVALFLILLVLIQRGRGGGLAGAFGGMGGQSAFGTKAGDLFTRITIVAASIWVVLCVLGVKYYNTPDNFSSKLGGAAKVDVQPGGAKASLGGVDVDVKASPQGTEAAPGTGETKAPEGSATEGSATETAPPATGSATSEAAPAEPAASEAPK
ncbi:MAG TPA: preprotein translocase subunit SecG [Pirellulales bacterium]|jgi:preprotein translocase subunit SecG